MECKISQVISELEALKDQNLIKYSLKVPGFYICINQHPNDFDALIDHIHKKLTDQQQNSVNKLNAMFSIAKNVSQCPLLTQTESQLQEGINLYFNMSHADQQHEKIFLPPLLTCGKQMTENELIHYIKGLYAISKDVVLSGHQIAKILYGIQSPRLESCTWFGSQYWGKGKHLDFDKCVKLGTQVIKDTKLL